MPSWLLQPWMHLKLSLVLLLGVYQWKTHIYFRQLQKDEIKHSGNFMRIWNEGATLLLFAIVFLVILKDSFHWITGLLGLIGIALILFLGIKLYKKTRKE